MKYFRVVNYIFKQHYCDYNDYIVYIYIYYILI